MMQRRTSSSSSVPTNPSLIRFPPPFTGNRVGAPPPPLPPLSPYSLPPRHSRSISQPSSFHSSPMSVEERNDVGFSPSMPPSPPFTMYHSTSRMVAGEDLPPQPRKSHRRTNSVDVTYGFGSMMPHTLMSPPSNSFERSVSLGEEPIFGGRTSESDEDDVLRYMNLDNMDVLSKTVEEEMESSSRGMRKTFGGNSSESEGESSASGNNMKGLKRRAGGDIAPSDGHYRSVSVDSCFMGQLNRLPPSSSANVSPTNSGEGSSNDFGVRVGNCVFTAAEMKKISADEKLAAMVMADPKRVKRTLANRVSAARSKERQEQYMAQLEHKVHTLRCETTTLSAHLTHLKRESMMMHNLNSELKFRLQAIEQQAQLRSALYERLTEEAQRLRLVFRELSGSESNISLNPEMFQQLRISQLQQQHSNQNSSSMKENFG